MDPVLSGSTWTDACFTLCNTTLMFPPALCLHSIFRTGRSVHKFYIFAAGIPCLKASETAYVGPFPASSSCLFSAFSRSRRFSSSTRRSSSSTAMIAWFKENIFMSSISTISAQISTPGPDNPALFLQIYKRSCAPRDAQKSMAIVRIWISTFVSRFPSDR